MAQYEKRIKGNFDRLLAHIEIGISQGSVSASREGGISYEADGVRCATRVYERFSYLGGNRLSLTVTVFGAGEDLYVSAITSGGSQAVFIKINTFGEEAFMRKFVEVVEKF